MKRLVRVVAALSLLAVASPAAAEDKPIEAMSCEEIAAAVAALAFMPVAGNVAAAKRDELAAAAKAKGCTI